MVFDAILHRGVDLGILGGDAEHAREPHPEHGARAARDDRGGHADDRAGADGARQGGDQGAELAHVAFAALVFDDGHLDGLRQLALNETRTNSQKDVGAQQQCDHERTPNDGIDLVEYADNVHITAFPRLHCSDALYAWPLAALHEK